MTLRRFSDLHPPSPSHPSGPDADVVDLTRTLISIPSVNPELESGGDGEGMMASWIGAWLANWGFRVELDEPAPDRFNMVARLGDASGPRILLDGHTDTVGVAGMEVAPFQSTLDDGRLYGRGSCDMKGGLAAILCAARNLARAGGPEHGELVVAFTADEEHASVGLRRLLDDGFTADEAIVCEPTSLTIQPANKGFVWLEVTVRGRAAHGSRPELGRDAIRDAGRLLAALDRYELALGDDSTHPLLGRGSIHAGTIRGGSAPPVYPDRCDLVLEARILPGQTPQQVHDRFRGIVAELERDHGIEVDVALGLSRPGSEIGEDHPLVHRLEDAIRAEGRTPEVTGMTAWVESAWLTEAGIPAVCFGPGALDEAHTATEFVPVAELEEAARILTRYLETAFADPAVADPARSPSDG